MASPLLLHALGQASRLSRIVSFARAAERPEATQSQKLQDILSANAHTEYGRRFGFSRVRNARQYGEVVPLMTSDSLAGYVERLMRGERGILTIEPPLFYTRTSGSGGKHKHIPITSSYKIDFQKTVHTALGHLYVKFPKAFTGRALYFVGTRRFEVAGDHLDIGTMSGYNFTELPKLLRSIYAWPYELFEVADLTTRSYLALYIAIVSDTSLVAGIFPAPLVYLLRELEARASELVVDLRAGSLRFAGELTESQRAFFARYAKPRPEIAARIEAAIGRPPHELTRAAFPMLNLIYCWKTASAELYIPELARRVGADIPIRDAIYAASEAWCSIPLGDDVPGGALAIESAFYEFIPEAAFEAGSRMALTVGELEQGERYFIVVTTASGLYRYVLGDVVEVCGRYRATPMIRFVRRRGGVVNLAGENVDEDHVVVGIRAAAARLGIEPTWFAWAPLTTEVPPRYRMWLETCDALPVEKLRAMAEAVEFEVDRVAMDYGRVRRAKLLAPLELVSVPAGTYERARRARLSDGSAEAQLKVNVLYRSVSEVEALLGVD